MLETMNGSVTGKLNILLFLAPALPLASLISASALIRQNPRFLVWTHKIFPPLLLVTSPGWFPPLSLKNQPIPALCATLF